MVVVVGTEWSLRILLASNFFFHALLYREKKLENVCDVFFCNFVMMID